MSVLREKAYHTLLLGQINRILQIMYANALAPSCSGDQLGVESIKRKT
jgi:hypothetical protein